MNFRGPTSPSPTEPSLAVVIPCFNARLVLRRTIESLLNQSYVPDEILVVDDGSSDDTALIAEKFGPPVKVIRQSNQGAALARYNGVLHANSDLVAFNDAGDISLPWRIEQLRTALILHHECVAAIALSKEKNKPPPKIFKVTGQPIKGQLVYLEDPLAILLGQSFPLVSGMNIAIRRNTALESTKIGSFYKAGNDYALQARTAAAGPFVCVHCISLEYELLSSGITARYGWMQQTGFSLCAAVDAYRSLPKKRQNYSEILVSRVARDWPGIALFAYLNGGHALLRRVISLGIRYGKPITSPIRFWWALDKALETGALQNRPILQSFSKTLRTVHQMLYK